MMNLVDGLLSCKRRWNRFIKVAHGIYLDYLIMKAIHYKWIFKRKECTTKVKKVKYTGELLKKRYIQIFCINFTYMFSPNVKHSSIQTLLGIVVKHDFKFEQLDIKTTFLHNKIELYFQRPRPMVNLLPTIKFKGSTLKIT